MKKAHLFLGTVIATLCSNPIQAQTVVSDSVAMGLLQHQNRRRSI
jgi:hypothetical protein